MGDWIGRIQDKYDKNNTAGLYIKLSIRTDTDIIQWK